MTGLLVAGEVVAAMRYETDLDLWKPLLERLTMTRKIRFMCA